jgi:hypothetical protein
MKFVPQYQYDVLKKRLTEQVRVLSGPVAQLAEISIKIRVANQTLILHPCQFREKSEQWKEHGGHWDLEDGWVKFHPVKTLFSYEEIDEWCCELGAPEYRKTDDGEAWYWCFSGSELPVADTLAELFLAARSK